MTHRQFGIGLFLLCCWTLVCAGPAAADNWPRFRGPNGTGVADDKDIPIQFGAKKGVLWSVPIPGVGNSSPVVWGDRLFLQSASSDGSERLLLCLNATSGKILWQASAAGARAHTHQKNTLASSTPATDGERVYAVFWNGEELSLSAYDFQGKELWKRELGGFTSQHGAGASPVVYDDMVYLANDQDGSAVMLAFDAKTGNPVWKATRKAYRACYSTPFLLEKPGDKLQLIVASTGGITGYNPRTGDEIWNWSWKFDGMALRIVASPIAGDGLIFANCGDGKGYRHAAAIKAGGKGDVTSTNLVWENKRALPYVPSMLLKGEHLYYVTDKGMAGCVVARTGETVWSERLGGEITASPVLINGKIYATNEAGTVYVFAAEPTFRLLAKNVLGEGVMATPAVANNRLFIRGQSNLFCIGKPPGK